MIERAERLEAYTRRYWAQGFVEGAGAPRTPRRVTGQRAELGRAAPARRGSSISRGWQRDDACRRRSVDSTARLG